MVARDWRKTFRWDEELSFDEAISLINHILECGMVVYSSHAQLRMEERSLTTQDIGVVLEHGCVIGQEFDGDNRNWKYKVQGKPPTAMTLLSCLPLLTKVNF